MHNNSIHSVKAIRLFVRSLSLDYCTKTRHALPADDARRYKLVLPSPFGADSHHASAAKSSADTTTEATISFLSIPFLSPLLVGLLRIAKETTLLMTTNIAQKPEL